MTEHDIAILGDFKVERRGDKLYVDGTLVAQKKQSEKNSFSYAEARGGGSIAIAGSTIDNKDMIDLIASRLKKSK